MRDDNVGVKVDPTGVGHVSRVRFIPFDLYLSYFSSSYSSVSFP